MGVSIDDAKNIIEIALPPNGFLDDSERVRDATVGYFDPRVGPEMNRGIL
jgi:hypothetical protein